MMSKRNKESGGITKKYTVLNLDCAHCGAKIEELICGLDGVSEASLSFPLKQLSLTAQNPDKLVPLIVKTARTVEADFDLQKGAAEEDEEKSESRRDIIESAAGLVMLIATAVLKNVFGGAAFETAAFVISVLAYIILGGRVLIKAGRNIANGKVFDENFLMSIATLGAFVIGEYVEAVGVMLFYRVGELFEDIAVRRSRSQIMQTVDMRPETVNLVSESGEVNIRAEEVRPGDVAIIRPGERVPLDGVVVEGETRFDTSAVTGEPVPVRAAPGDRVVSGCINMSGLIKLRVENTLENSMVSRVLDSVENAAANKPRIDRFITKFSKVYTPIVVAVAAVTAVLVPLITGDEFYPWVYTALSFLVMSCPCALVLSVPLAYFCGVGAGSKRHILFKGGAVLEALSGIKSIVMDKTGTITKGTFSVSHIMCAEGFDENEVLLYSGSAEAGSTHPIAKSIGEECARRGLSLIESSKAEEIAGRGIKASVGGREVAVGSAALMKELGIDIGGYSSAEGCTEVLTAIDGRYAGSLVISDIIKPEAENTVAALKRRGIVTAMLTGDSENEAERVGRKVGVDRIYSRLLPDEKYEKLREIREAEGAVMFIGDGINDAPVLAGADVGAAMGSGADAAIEAADVVFMNSNLECVESAIAIAKKTAAVAMENVVFALAVKIAVMILGLTGIYSNMWLAVFADTGVAFLCILNSVRVLLHK
ncbi:MAG TPA: cadmium-translocating P-type ATPase [Candidatus Monoglobus merdigallinarum]|uniref:Cd(2+)-exporting ATPase n=1 Tax=Candidatus Monoglobus merdigallinarum TaxID=2838698 RepID=A0A9D1TM34_9FIRM|nr:cadmium-translocating P-type ATPase [Candidatus Monoglobus merdigallinarum]